MRIEYRERGVVFSSFLSCPSLFFPFSLWFLDWSSCFGLGDLRFLFPKKKLLYISKTKISIRRTYTELQLAWEGPSQTTRISKFEGKTAALYFIFLSHFLMPLIRRRLWFGLGMVYVQRYSPQLGGSKDLAGFE